MKKKQSSDRYEIDTFFKYTGKTQQEVQQMGMTQAGFVNSLITKCTGIPAKYKTFHEALWIYTKIRGTQKQLGLDRYNNYMIGQYRKRMSWKTDLDLLAFCKQNIRLEFMFNPTDYSNYYPRYRVERGVCKIILGNEKKRVVARFFNFRREIGGVRLDLGIPQMDDEFDTFLEKTAEIHAWKSKILTINRPSRRNSFNVVFRNISIKNAIHIIKWLKVNTLYGF